MIVTLKFLEEATKNCKEYNFTEICKDSIGQDVCDDWYGTESIDVNLFVDEDYLTLSVYPVVNGYTDTSKRLYYFEKKQP